MKVTVILFLCAGLVTLSCGEKKANEKNEEAQVKVPAGDAMESTASLSGTKTEPGVYFKASGTEPFWSLTVSEKMIKFKTPGDSILTPHAEPVYAQDANVKSYLLHTELAEVKIHINQGECVNTMSGMVSPYSVTVEHKKGRATEFTKVEGCGEYITDYRLHDIWVLEKLKGSEVSKEDFGKELPYIEINSGANTFFGTTGCNRINGQLFFEKNKLRFVKVATTKMMCKSDGKKEQEFLEALNSTVSYSIADNRLTLSNPDDVLLVFKKVD